MKITHEFWINSVYKILPVFTFFTNRFVGKNFAGTSFLMFSFIRPDYIDDIGLFNHEKIHAKQFYRTFGLSEIFYPFDKYFRLRAEAEAYAVQLLSYPESKFEELLNLFSKFIATKYDLYVDETLASMNILKWVKKLRGFKN